MESWLLLTIASGILSSLSGFFDNFITDEYFKGRLPQAQKCFFGPVYLLFAILIFFVYGFFIDIDEFPVMAAVLTFLTGVISSIASIPYYSALKTENTTGAAIFSEMMPVFYLTMGAIFLGQQITGIYLIAFCILVAAPLVIILSQRKRGKKMELRSAGFFIMYLLIYSISRIIFVFAEGGNGTSSALPIPYAIAFLLAGKGTIDIILIIAAKKWRTRFKNVIKTSKKKILIPFSINACIWVTTEFLANRALVLGQVAVVSAISSSVTLLATFIFGLVFTIVWPRFGREKLDKRTVAAHLIATILSIVGILLIEKPDIFIGG